MLEIIKVKWAYFSGYLVIVSLHPILIGPKFSLVTNIEKLTFDLLIELKHQQKQRNSTLGSLAMVPNMFIQGVLYKVLKCISNFRLLEQPRHSRHPTLSPQHNTQPVYGNIH